jgi:hypothetical protein
MGMTKTTEVLEVVPQPDTIGSNLREWQVEIEERVRKLETAIGEHIPTTLMESVDHHPLAELPTADELPHALVGSDRVLVLASSHDEPLPPPKGVVLHPPEAAADPARHTWFLMQLWAELRLAIHMYFDPRYRISRTTQFAIPAIALLVLFNYFVFSSLVSLPIVSQIAERFLDVVICVIGYKLLIRELGRYRGVLEYLGRYGKH